MTEFGFHTDRSASSPAKADDPVLRSARCCTNRGGVLDARMRGYDSE